MNYNLADLTGYMTKFMGYGSLHAPIWFLGAEEGGEGSAEALLNRVDTWKHFGRETVGDIYEFHKRIGGEDLFGDRPRIQRTWGKLIEIALLIEGLEPTRDSVREFQASRLGRKDGGLLLGELMPLPKRKLGSWPYAGLKELVPYLATKKSYLEEIRPVRIAMLRDAIKSYVPKQVLFYSTSGHLRDAWREIADVELVEQEGGYLTGRSQSTRFVVSDAPTAWGRNREYFHKVAELLRT